MRFFSIIFGLFILLAAPLSAQHDISIEAKLKEADRSLDIVQTIVFKNTTETVLNELYLNDWANSFSSKTTPLAKRFAENYSPAFHFEKDDERGRTKIYSISDERSLPLTWERTAVDIIKIELDTPLQPGEAFTIIALYNVKLPKAKFTRYGAAKNGDYKLRYWYLSPAVYDGAWEIYSNKNTDDLYAKPSRYEVTITAPSRFTIISDLNEVSTDISEENSITKLEGDNRLQAMVQLRQRPIFETIATDKLDVITNLEDKKVTAPIKALAIDRIVHFLDERLGSFPNAKLLSTESAYRTSPVYGLNQLPDFISPFPDGFQYDMEQLKTISRAYIENSLNLHPRKDYWLQGALQIYLMAEYVDTYYPKMKIMGNLSNFWLIRWSHASDLEFNDQYPLLYQNMARNNLHQSLVTPKDSLLKFNKNIANDYYAGDGFQYLADYLGKDVLLKSIKEFFTENKLRSVTSEQFQEVLERNTDKPVAWFFEEYVKKRGLIDFKIDKIKRQGDSVQVTIKNRENNTMPVALYGLKKDSVVFKKWLAPFDSLSTITVPATEIKHLALNYEGHIPELNDRNNYKNLKGILNRPLQFRLFQDIQDPKYNQLFFMPIVEYNLYDGATFGVKLYNKTILPKDFHYKLEPQFGFRSKTLIGSGSVVYTDRIQGDSNLYSMRYGIAGSYYSYNTDLFYKRFGPFMTFAFRNTDDLRDNEKQFINIRNVNVFQDENVNDPNQDPNYSVFNAQYVYSNPNLINYYRGVVDYEISSRFSKLSTTFTYRKLFLNNRQLNVRAFAGVFLYNDTAPDDNFFSFALDRPTDYLFDYNYYGRSEDSGLFSQQLIIAEGGFKSQLDPAFANSWMTTVNASTNIWKWIFAYGDAGLVHNKGRGTAAVFDSGIRLSLVADYFELYFPLYSNLGWEPGLPNYDQRIRFIVTLSPSTLLGLFTREWY